MKKLLLLLYEIIQLLKQLLILKNKKKDQSIIQEQKDREYREKIKDVSDNGSLDDLKGL